ncbi:MAG: hypothetical protein A2233_03025 [Candidatus Kerfeldbacteria bacterium RIFOXYA2_FULL_38_24]|uniref:Pseudouridine synthase n=1 Tax=Candidatus Kerfeldbacteria bacterium RIFOXYB2_FULL_38_14 TaxID=1798547 RepID=A0A1G2BGV6_9BACT|nr:MAG: hypothetical protein A2319_04995 [Candidatus Kerfeldbacteria bacterium RIFOXYB2_FULL_38_14]OGY88318.1 MAG: hypothetical protein A2233_03025 [Candidatus Kerfeldbacteria bacterium RIFOXYA2_FULL_38_24]OGY88630.1 MAG: hypothetical protein A2458_03210 [Candidatus Kerfeldbacteria bacterium RIFOXYC2_FULL_38_9]
MRLNKFIAHSGWCSRRKADALIADGKVSINGMVVKVLGTQVQDQDEVAVDGICLAINQEKIIVAMNKPKGVTCTCADAHAEKTVIDLLPKKWQHLKPAGRLDKNSEGLLLLTNDGALHQQLTHPSFAHEKEYAVTVRSILTANQIADLKKGIIFPEGKAQLKSLEQTGEKTLTMVLTQGYKRQIRRMVYEVGNRVTMILRVRIGKFRLNLTQGQIKQVKKSDIL